MCACVCVCMCVCGVHVCMTYVPTSCCCVFADYFKAQALAADIDIHAVAGLLKKYFRELPEPLFTTMYYTSFIQGYSEY